MSFLNPKLQALISNPTGLDPATKAAMTSQAINDSATTYQNALKGVQANLASRGGPTATSSGVEAQLREELAAGEAGTEASSLNQIQQQDAELKNQNQWRAVMQGLEDVTVTCAIARRQTGPSDAAVNTRTPSGKCPSTDTMA